MLLVEHPPVITFGRNARREHLLLPVEEIRSRGIDVFESGRGGDVTCHGPGQAVVYPILDLSPDRRDVHRYVRDLEEVMIRSCADFGVTAHRKPKMTGAWVGDGKVGAIGVHIARWVTSHGLAFNVSNDLALFSFIVPCGITGKRVTSLAEILGWSPPLDEVFQLLGRHLTTLFGRDVTFLADPPLQRLAP